MAPVCQDFWLREIRAKTGLGRVAACRMTVELQQLQESDMEFPTAPFVTSLVGMTARTLG
jgi:hypothetical protein